MKVPLLAAALVASAFLVGGDATADCPPQPTHAYLAGPAVLVDAPFYGPTGLGVVLVQDSALNDCDGDGVPQEFDGDMELGVGGGFFGWGPWANAEGCEGGTFGMNVHGPRVVGRDTLGRPLTFIVGEDDQSGPVHVTGRNGEPYCETDGSITPMDDDDDCFSAWFVGEGRTCGTGGGDGGYWVFVLSPTSPADGSLDDGVTGTLTAGPDA